MTIDPVLLDLLRRRDQSATADFFVDDGAITIDPARRYQYKSIKVLNNISREEDRAEKIEFAFGPIGEGTSFPNTSPEGLEPKGSQGEGNNVALGENYTSRAYTGIGIQHARTDRGVKLFITLQTAQDAQNGQWVQLTAELRHRKRLREIKTYEFDDEYFQLVIDTIIETVRDRSDQNWYVGRIHERKARSRWFKNAIVKALIENNHCVRVQLCLDDELYEIEMNQPMSERQQNIYYSSGQYGIVKRAGSAPSLATARREKAK